MGRAAVCRGEAGAVSWGIQRSFADSVPWFRLK